jgi:hypothetical protein
MGKCVGIEELHTAGLELQETDPPEPPKRIASGKGAGRKITTEWTKSDYRKSFWFDSETYKLSELRARHVVPARSLSLFAQDLINKTHLLALFAFGACPGPAIRRRSARSRCELVDGQGRTVRASDSATGDRALVREGLEK